MLRTAQGFLPPRMTEAQRDAIGTPATGLIVYNTDDNTVDFYDGDSWEVVGPAVATVAADSLDFDDFADAMTLDASTSIAGSGTNALSITQSGSVAALRITNTGSGNSFLVEDEASTDATPFVINASGDVGIGSATPAVKLDVAGAITASSLVTATGFAPTASTATGNRLYLPAADTLGLAIAGAGEVQLTGTALSPVTTDGNALGTSTRMWSDLFLAEEGIISFDDGNMTIEHSTNALIIAGGDVDVWGTLSGDTISADRFVPLDDGGTAIDNSMYLAATNTLGFSINGTGEVQLTSTALSPITNNGNALGTTSLMWSDLFLASGAVVNFNNGDVTITHAADNLAIAGGTLTMGTNGGTNGQITFAGSTSGTVAVRAAAAAGTGTIFQLPADNGTDGYVLQTDGTGVTSWVDPGAATVGDDSLDFDKFVDAMTLDASTSITADGTEVLSIVNTGTGNSFLVEDQASDTTPFVIAADGKVGIGSATPAVALDVVGAVTATGAFTSGTNGGTNGQITFAGSTSGTVAVRAAAAAGTGTIFQLPSSNGTNGYVLQTDGSGVTSWVAAGGGGSVAIDDLTDAETEYSSQHNMFLGSGAGAGIQAGGTYNLALGELALAAVTTGDHNLALGYGALDSLTTSLRNVGIGYNALTAITTGGNDNVALGYNAGAAITTADETVAIGSGALASLTTSLRNTAVGFNTLSAITNSGNDNTALGYSALESLVDGFGNTAVGLYAMTNNAGSQHNTAVGTQAMADAGGEGSFNTAIGSQTLLTNDTGGHNVAVGYTALGSNIDGNQNTALGAGALAAAEDGSENTAIGFAAMVDSAGGESNTAVGAGAMGDASGGSFNTALGGSTLGAVTTGEGNTGIGYEAGDNLTEGSQNIVIGHQVDAPSATADGQIVIGNLIFATGATGTGTTISTGFVGIGSNAPGYRLELPNTASTSGQGRANAWQTYSDGRFKKDLKPIAGALNKVMALKGVTYRSALELNARREVGLIAQDVEKVLPEAVSISTTEVVLPGEKPKKVSDYRSLAYDRLVALLVEAVKELKQFTDGVAAKVEKLVAQVTGHDAAIKELKAANDNLRFDLEAANDNYAAEIEELKEDILDLKAAIKARR